MEAKDTVMGKEKRSLVRAHWLKGGSVVHDNLMKAVAEYQAEISFTAGIREVVEWSDDKCPHCIGWNVKSRRKCELCWQAKLKEWGME